jgi:hypothetical protein
MSRGIYITANDRVTEQAIALLNSIRLYDSDTPIVLIPYDEQYHKIAQLLAESYGVKVYQDLAFIERLSQNLHDIFGTKFFARPNQFRKQACWFGEFDEFLYIDTDIVVFEKIIDNLTYLNDHDFICCDYQHKAGIKNVFTSKVIEERVFDDSDLQGVFNGGFWASKKNLISEQDLYDTFLECANHPDYFDFSQKTSDQPIINYMILKRIQRRLNLVRLSDKGPGNWAGSANFQVKDNILVDINVNRPLQYLHWAGIKIQPGCPYWDIWKYYRYLGNEDFSHDSLASEMKTATSSKNFGNIDSQLNTFIKKVIYKIKWTLFRKSGTTELDPDVQIYIISYPKSGRTWLRVLLGKVICEQFNLDEGLLLNTLKLTRKAGIPAVNWTHDGSGLGEGPHFIRFIKDKSIFKNKKVIFLYRDPKDVMVSSYFHATKRIYKFTHYSGSITEFIRSRGYGIKKLINFYNIWHENQDVPQNFLLIRYEDLHANTTNTLRSVLDFLEIKNVENEVIEKAIHFASFNNMKSMEKSTVFKSNIMQARDENDNESYKVRKGKVGKYIDYLSPEDIQYIDKVIDKMGCPFYKDLP